MPTCKLTTRRGSKVTREKYSSVDDAVEAIRAQAESVIEQGPLPERKMIRTFEPSTQVAARFEISTGGPIGGETAGLDVMGDGRLVAFRGAVVRRELEPAGGETPYDAVREALQ